MAGAMADPYGWPMRALRSIWSNPGHPEYDKFDLTEAYTKLFECTCSQVPPMSAIRQAKSDKMQPLSGVLPVAFGNMCPCFSRRYVMYGYIAQGSFGAVYTARERQPVDPGHIRHFAVKIQGAHDRTTYETELVTPDPTRPERCVHREALALYFCRHQPRIIPVVEAYQHGPISLIVMELFGVDAARYDTLREMANPLQVKPRRVRNFTGQAMVPPNSKRSALDETQANKVATQLLAGIEELAALRLVHQDLSHRNYLLDGRLNTRIIDLDSARPRFREADYGQQLRQLGYLEHVIAPELCAAQLVDGGTSLESDDCTRSNFPSDSRRDMLYVFSALTFELLHGYSPWEDTEMLGFSLNADLAADASALEVQNREFRRRRMVRYPVQVREGCSQDAADLMQCSLKRVPDERPGLPEVGAFPWYGAYRAVEMREGPGVSVFDRDEILERARAPVVNEDGTGTVVLPLGGAAEDGGGMEVLQDMDQSD